VLDVFVAVVLVAVSVVDVFVAVVAVTVLAVVVVVIGTHSEFTRVIPPLHAIQLTPLEVHCEPDAGVPLGHVHTCVIVVV